MSNTNTGGPAFPVPDIDGSAVSEGMTLRDYFAAKASEGDILEHSQKGFIEEYVFYLRNGRKELRNREARWTREQSKYRYADAMLKAREA
jgi:hypothetical protein